MGFAREHGIEALCFDLDGTFYPKRETNEYLVLSFFCHPIFSLRYNSMRQQMRKLDGLAPQPVMTREEFRRRECLMIYGRERSDYSSLYQKLLSSWMRTSRLIRTFPALKEALTEARAQGYILGLLSDFPIAGKLETLGIPSSLFSYIASTDEYGYLKPNATPFLQMCKEMGVEPSRVLYTGDSERKDVLGAGNAGLMSALLDVGGRKKQSAADLHLSSWQDFIDKVLD